MVINQVEVNSPWLIDTLSGMGLKRSTVELHEYQDDWARDFESEKTLIQSILPGAHIEHVGSTSVPGLLAKPVIDIAVGVADHRQYQELVNPLLSIGYVFMPDRVFESRIFFPKGPVSNRTHYLHLVTYDSDEWRSLLLFRDELRASTSLRDAYAKLKTKLEIKYASNRTEYTTAKNSFISSVLSSNT